MKSTRKVTLTFDNGPTPEVTPFVLETLADHGVDTTFFVIGERLQHDGARGVARDAAAQGHWIGNHTLTHSVMLGRFDTPEVAEREIGGAQAALGELAHAEKLFRPWGGGRIGPWLLGHAAVDLLCRDGYTCVLWNNVPRDWENPAGWVETCLVDIARREWSVVVLHDIESGAMAKLPEFLTRLEQEGVEVVQAFPDDCVPIREGATQWPLDGLMPQPGAAG
jgi:peptidoglycan/xylan/chitin deacetylase (PgdA/CDA1 family)